MQAAKAMATRIPFEIGTTRAVELQLRAHGGEMKISPGAMGRDGVGRVEHELVPFRCVSQV